MRENEKKNIITNFVAQIIVAVSGLILPKLIIGIYGSTLNGMVNSLRQFLSYAGLIELGIGNAVITALYKPLAEKCSLEVSKILSETQRRYNKIGIVYMILVCLIAVFYPLAISGQVEYQYAMSMTFVIAASTIIDFFIIGKYKVLLIADGKYYVINIINIVATVIMTGISFLLINSGKSLIAVKATAGFTHLLEALSIKYYTLKRYHNLNYHCTKEINFSQQKSTMIHQICMVITYNTDLVLMTLLMKGDSLKEISVYTVYAMVLDVIKKVVASVYTGLGASYGQLYAEDRLEELKVKFDGFEEKYYAILTMFYSCMLVLIIPFVKIYTKDVQDVNYVRMELAILFVLCGYFSQAKEAYNLMVGSCGLYSDTQKYAISEAVVNLLLSVLLIRQYGIVGLLIGTMISHIIMALGMMSLVSQKILNNSAKKSMLRIGRNLGIGTLLVFSEIKLLPMIESFTEWIIDACIVTIINCIIIGCISYMCKRKIVKFA